MMSGALSRRAGRVEWARRIQGQVALVFLALGSIGSFLLGHEIAGDLAVRAIYTTASQDQLRYSPVTLSASGALGARISVGAPRSGRGSSAHRTPPGGGSRARGQAPSGKSGQARSGLGGTLAGHGHQPGWTARGADESQTASDTSGMNGSSITQSGSPGALSLGATMPVEAPPCVASSPADITLSGIDASDGIDDADPADTLPGCPFPSTDQVSDETAGRPCTTAPGTPLLLAWLASPHDAGVAGTEA